MGATSIIPGRKSPVRFVRLMVLVGMSTLVAHAELAQAQPGSGPSISAIPVVQFNGNVIKLPANKRFTTSRTSGLMLQVNSKWVNGYGYHPIQVSVQSMTPTKASHSIRIQLHSGWYRGTTVEQEFELPAGSLSATESVLLPIYSNSNDYLWWDLWVDNIRDKELSLDRQASVAWAGSIGNARSGINVLAIGTSASTRSLVSTNNTELQVFLLDPADLPTKWLDYSSFDVIELTVNQAQQLAKTNPAAFAAMLQWVRAGGQLWISDVGQQLEHLPQASQLVGLPSTLIPQADEVRNRDEADQTESADNSSESSAGDGANKGEDPAETTAKPKSESTADKTDKKDNESAATSPADAERPRQEGWRPIQFRRFRGSGRAVTFLDTRTGARNTVRDPETIAQLERDANFVNIDERLNPEVVGRERRFTGFATDSSEWFVEQPLGFGSVRAYRGTNEAGKFATSQPAVNSNAAANSDSSETLPRSLALSLRRTLRWETRHGLTPDGASAEFADLLVPGVGMAPVTEFRVLITLFVLLIGPLNYWLLRRSKRLYLMVLTVPLAAVVTTLALFAYAIVADGFSSQVRVHSVTRLDQRTGDASCWARLSYYSGLAPGKGLTMSSDTALYPIQPSWANDVSRLQQRTMVWNGNECRFTQGWLNSRTPSQYLAVRSHKVRYGLEILDSGDKLRVRNGFGTKIQFLAVLSAAGKWYEGQDIAPDGSLTLAAATRDDVIRQLNRIVAENAPHAPTELSEGEAELKRMRARSRFGIFGRYGVNDGSANLSENLAGMALAELVGVRGQPALDLPAKSYVAITEHGPEVEVGFPDVTEEASFHVVEGRW